MRVCCLQVMYYRETGEPRGLGFIKMSTVEEADKAMEMFHCFDLNGRPLIVHKATPRGTSLRSLGCKIFVANLPFDLDDERLEQLFSEHGEVVNAQIVYDTNTRHSRGIRFVAMSLSTEAEMNDAIANLNGKTIGGRLIQVNFAQEKPS
ncbi:hypothetical protein RHMOL_Rhmol08G0249400 [Rhododendron molle]|uniref:Uncharacterized protein n=1 Tax=Rhododendron molle TaxID=49168 RepID=A0ACC0MTJ0_RHOML|nr:hypothetical protein RHMOL_Rhmol08G0249400 [Rhododendron molle]